MEAGPLSSREEALRFLVVFFFPLCNSNSSKWVKVHLSCVCGNSPSLCLNQAAVPMPRPSFTSLVCAVTGNLKGEKGSVTSPKEVIIEVLGPAFSLKNLKCMYFFLPNPSMPTHPLCLFYSSGSPRGSRSQVCLGGLVDCRVRREIGFKTWIRF